MAFHISFLMVLGTIYAYSTWSEQFIRMRTGPGPFPTWTADDLGFVYSMGIFGAFLTPLGGIIYDFAGPTTTYIVGLTMALAGFAGMVAIMQVAAIPDHQARYMMGLLYYLEEQGSSTLYMGIALDTLVHFPAGNVSLSMGLVALGYSLSSVAFSFIASMWECSVTTLILFLAAAMTAFTVVRVAVLGDISAAKWHPVSAGEEEPSLADVVRKPAFRGLILASFLGLSLCTSLLGFVKPLGDASGTNGAELAQATLVTNCIGRVGAGFLYDYCRHIPSQSALFIVIVGVAAGFALLVLQSSLSGSLVVLWAGCLCVTFPYGSSAPVSAAYIKDYFPASLNGTVLGLHHVAIAVGNFFFMSALGPTETRTAEGFKKPLQGALLCSMMACFSILYDFMLSRSKLS